AILEDLKKGANSKPNNAKLFTDSIERLIALSSEKAKRETITLACEAYVKLCAARDEYFELEAVRDILAESIIDAYIEIRQAMSGEILNCVTMSVTHAKMRSAVNRSIV